MNSAIDHLVIGASNLERGVEYVKDLLEVDIPYGGAHMSLGTHNHLMQLGNNTFLEVIAINEKIKPPRMPRWYGLDDPFVRRQIAEKPTLLTWVVNTKNIETLIKKAVFSLGKSELVRRGELSWNFGLPEDGRLLAGGLLPYAIEWHSENHPSLNMADLNCQLLRLEIYHPYTQWLKHALVSIDALDLVDIIELPDSVAPYLVAHISTPSGPRKLSSLCGI